MVVVIFSSAYQFRLMALGTIVLNAVAGVEVGIEVVTGVTMHGLINFFVIVAMITAAVWSARLGSTHLAWIHGDIAPRSALEILTAPW